jgi:hypothetical protein
MVTPNSGLEVFEVESGVLEGQMHRPGKIFRTDLRGSPARAETADRRVAVPTIAAFCNAVDLIQVVSARTIDSGRVVARKFASRQLVLPSVLQEPGLISPVSHMTNNQETFRFA